MNKQDVIEILKRYRFKETSPRIAVPDADLALKNNTGAENTDDFT